MFKIEAIQNSNRQKEIASKCQTVSRDGCFAYVMFDVDSGDVMGFSQFDIRDGVGIITDLREPQGNNDFEAMFILGRSTMNFIDLCGAHSVKAPKDAAEESLIKAIGFKLQENGEYFCDMTGFFDGHCSGH